MRERGFDIPWHRRRNGSPTGGPPGGFGAPPAAGQRATTSPARERCHSGLPYRAESEENPVEALITWPIEAIYKRDQDFQKEHPDCPIVSGWITVSKKQFSQLAKRMKENRRV